MGMYTELHFNAELKKDTPQWIIDVLRYMLEKTEVSPKLPDHPLFLEGVNWLWMLQSDSYCFDADTCSTLRFDRSSVSYFLCIRCNLKNYNEEISKFVSWIIPYLDKEPGDFIGFFRFEETEQPTLLFMP
jgi:hypothetical protein